MSESKYPPEVHEAAEALWTPLRKYMETMKPKAGDRAIDEAIQQAKAFLAVAQAAES